MAKLEQRIKRIEQHFKQKRQRRSRPPKNNIFILPDDQKRYQAFVRYAKNHANEREWVAIVLPAKQESR